MRFLCNANGDKRPTQSILDVGIDKALTQMYFDKQSFIKRDGQYEKTKLVQSNKKQNCTEKDHQW